MKCYLIYPTIAAVCSMSQNFTGNQTENTSFAVSKCFTVNV